MGLQIN